MAKVAKVINYTELSDINNINIISWEKGDFFAKKNIKRANISSLVFKTPVLDVAFDCKPNKFNDSKYDTTIRIDNEEFYNIINGSLKKKFIKVTQENIDHIGYEDDEEMIEEFCIIPFNQKEGYDPLFNGRIEENKYKGITFSDIVIDKNDQSIENPDLINLLKRGTKVMLIIEIPFIDYYQTEFRPGFKIMRIKIVENAPIYKKHYITHENFLKDKIKISEVKTNDNGGKSSRIRYHNGENEGQLAFMFEDVRLAPFSFVNKDENTGKDYYGVSITIDSEEYKDLITSTSNDIRSYLGKNSKDLLGKKKTDKMIKVMYRELLKYSNDDLELIKKGESSKYPPRFDISAPKYDEKFGFKFLDKDGNEIAEDFGDYKASHSDTRYNIKCSCRHFWYGKTYSTKFVLDEIQIATSVSKSVKYNFDADESNNDEGGDSAESEPDEEVVESDNDSEPEDSD
jgi:hypothetical protein